MSVETVKKLWAFLLVLLIQMSVSDYGYCSDGSWSYFEKNKIGYLSELSKSVYKCINSHDTAYPVFYGCIDWHSSVHGHWALLRAARYTHEKKYIDHVVNKLSSEGLEKERIYLDKNRLFEMPYGRAWFLRLAIEYEIVTQRQELRPMADEVALSLTEYYTSNAVVAGIPEYENAEWAFRNLYDYSVFTKNKSIEKFVTDRVQQFAAKPSGFTFEADKVHYPEFFSRYGNYLHLLYAALDSNSFMRILLAVDPSPKSMLPVTHYKNAHHLAINYARSWGIWSAYKRSNAQKYRDAYLKNINAGYKLHHIYKDRYLEYGHWVPQFGIYAITTSQAD